jgi:hypothetical protein
VSLPISWANVEVRPWSENGAPNNPSS